MYRVYKTSKVLLLLFCAVFIPYFILCFYDHPIADDYTYTPAAPFWGSQLDIYRHWNGRYIANFMVLCNPMVFKSLTGYRFAAFFMLLLMPLSIYFLLSSLIRHSLPFLEKMGIAILIALIILALLPSLPEGIYWYTGSITYILGCVFAMFYIGTAARHLQQKFIVNRAFHFFICALLLCIAVGFNEVQMLLLLFGHFVFFVTKKKEERFRSKGFTLLLLCLFFSSFVFFSPGNHYRSAYFPGNHNLVKSIYMSVLQTVRFFFAWVSYAPLLLAGILYAPLSIKLSKRSALFNKAGSYNPLILFSLLWVILFICIFPAYWSTAILGQHRTLNTACFFFVPTWFIFLHCTYLQNNLSEKINLILKKPVKIWLTLLLAASLLFSGNSGIALMDIATGKAAAFNREMNVRYKLLCDAKKAGQKEVAVPELENKPASLFVLDVRPGYNYLVNTEYAHYFGFKKVYMDSLK